MRKYSSKEDSNDLKNIQKAIEGSDFLTEDNISFLKSLDKGDEKESFNKALAENIHNPFSQSPNDSKIRLNLFLSNDENQDILNTIKRANIYGFGGNCFAASEAIMDYFFEPDNDTYIVCVLNKFLFEYGRKLGHSAVYTNGAYIDSDGRIKSFEEIESWGMVDEESMSAFILEDDLSYELELLDNEEGYPSKLAQACEEILKFEDISFRKMFDIDNATINNMKIKLNTAEKEMNKLSSDTNANRLLKIASLTKTSERIKVLVPDLKLSNEMMYHVNNNIKLASNIFRVHSSNFLNLFNEARELYSSGKIDVCDEDKWLLNTDIGKTAMLDGVEVMLDVPMEIDDDDSVFSKLAAKKPNKKVNLNSPRRIGKNDPGHGRKKFIVHVKDPSTGRVKTITFGDPNLSIKANNPERRKSFLARHNCDSPGPKTGARYWSCNLHRYKKQLGLKFEGRW
jgi:hypothetical protein